MALSVVTLVLMLFATAFVVESSIKDGIKDKFRLSRDIALDIAKRTIPTDRVGELNMRCSEEKLDDILVRLSVTCQNYLFQEEDSLEFEEESTLMCDSCGSTLFSLLECVNTDPTELKLFNALCADNENGDTCYSLLSGEGMEEGGVIEKCQDLTCSGECFSVLQESLSDFGCCLYSLVATNTSVTMARNIWSVCGLDLPTECAPAFDEITDENTGSDDDDDDSTTQLPNGDTSSTTSDSTDGVMGGQEGSDTATTGAGRVAELSFSLVAALVLVPVINYLCIK
jgi:hypothetical protein